MITCSWNIEESKKSSSGKFLKVKPGCKLMFRLIGQPVKVIKIFSHDRKCAIINSENIGQSLIDRYPHRLSSVNVRYACWCIDRVDNSLKILDMPVSIARALGDRQVIAGKKIADIIEGCDWSIVTNGKKGKDARYKAVYIKESPLTNSEIQMVEDQKSGENGHFDLTKIFKSHDYAEAEEILFGI